MFLSGLSSVGYNVFKNIAKLVYWDTIEKRISGKLVHDSGEEGNDDPIYSHKVDLYKKLFGGETFLATATTNKEGKFEFKYTHYAVSFSDTENLVLKVHRTGTRGLLAYLHPIIAEVSFEKPFEKTDFNLTILRAKVLEYNLKKNNPIPELIEDWTQIDFPNDFEFLKTIVGESWQSILLSFGIKPFESWMTVDDVCKMFNKTVRTQFTSERLINLVTNGIYIPKIEEDEKTGNLIIRTHWNPKSINYSPEVPDVINACIFLEKTEKGLELLQIDIQYFKKDGKKFEEKKPEEIYEKISYFPKNEKGEENKNFIKALQLASSAFLLAGQIQSHLAEHYFAGKVTRMFGRCIINNPIGEAVKAPNHATEATNAAARPLLTEKDTGALTETGFKQEGLISELSEGILGVAHPFEERFPNDIFAKRARCVRDTLHQAYTNFVKNRYEDIVKDWHEVFYLSENNMKYGVNPVRITKNKDKPETGDIDKLIDFLTDHGYYSSYGHWFVHKSQKDYSLNPDVSMGPNVYFSKDRLGDGDPFMGVKPDFAYKQVSIGIALIAIGDKLSPTRSLLTHPDQIQEVIDAITANKDQWDALELDPKVILASINS